MTNRQTIHDLLARLTEDRHEAEVGSLRRVIAEERARADRCTREATDLREMLDDTIESLELLAPVSSAVPSLHPASIFDELATRGLHHHPDTAAITVTAAWDALRAVLDRARDLEAAAARPVDLGVAGPDTPVMVDAGLVPDERPSTVRVDLTPRQMERLVAAGWEPGLGNLGEWLTWRAEDADRHTGGGQ